MERTGFAAVSARRAPLLGRIVTSSRVGVGGDEGGGLIRVGVVEQLRLHTGKPWGAEVEKRWTPKRPQGRRKGGW